MNAQNLATPAKPVPLSQFVSYFLWLGTVGFGGPIALAGHMQQDLVDKRRWVTKEDYVEGLALAQLAPGPLAAQLAIYLGYIRAGVVGATLVGIAFVLPSFLMVLALSAAYVRYGGLNWMQGMFYGIGAAVIAIIARSAVKLTKLTLGKDRLLWAIFLTLAVATAWTSREIIWLFLARWGGRGDREIISATNTGSTGVASLLLAGVAMPAGGVLWQIFEYFAKAGLFVFGSGLAIVPFLYGGTVLRTSLADGPPIRRCRGCGDDHTGAGGDYGGLHRIPGSWACQERRRLRWECSCRCISWC